jgi:hypothetical protein
MQRKREELPRQLAKKTSGEGLGSQPNSLPTQSCPAERYTNGDLFPKNPKQKWHFDRGEKTAKPEALENVRVPEYCLGNSAARVQLRVPE